MKKVIPGLILCFIYTSLAFPEEIPSIFTITQAGFGAGIDLVSESWPLGEVIDWHYTQEQIYTIEVRIFQLIDNGSREKIILFQTKHFMLKLEEEDQTISLI